MPHSWSYDIASLRSQVATTIATFKLEKERLHNVQLKNTEELEFSDRNIIINWSRASIADFSEKLDVMEKVEQPTAEERQVMQQLTELVFLGDQIGDVQGEVERRLDAKFGRVKWMAAGELPEGAYLREDGKMVVPRKKQKAVKVLSTALEGAVSNVEPGIAPLPPSTASPASQAPLDPQLETSSTVAKTRAATVADDDEEQYDGGNAIDRTSSSSQAIDASNVAIANPDPEGAYAMLGLTPEASMEHIKRAARKMTVMLHPDKNKTDPDAGIKFAAFMTLYRETLDGEEKRQAYDNITPDQLSELTKRVRDLTAGTAPSG